VKYDSTGEDSVDFVQLAVILTQDKSTEQNPPSGSTTGKQVQQEHTKRWHDYLDLLLLRKGEEKVEISTSSSAIGGLWEAGTQVGMNSVEQIASTRSRHEVDEQVFLQTHIPRSLHEFPNPYQELQRLQDGERESVVVDSVFRLLAPEGAKRVDDSRFNVPGQNASVDVVHSGSIIESDKMEGKSDHKVTAAEVHEVHGIRNKEIRQPQPDQTNIDVLEVGEISGEEADDSSDESSDDSIGWLEDKNEGKYRARLPTRDNPEARLKAKEERKEAARIAKQAAQEKRKEKIPKHIKKRAVKAGSKKR
jgi:hypothetical protein